MKISVIIPTLNESARIGRLIRYLHQHGGSHLLEVIIVDGGSHDDTMELASNEGARVFMSEVSNRGSQMNIGAKRANGSILYFLHADALPPANYAEEILNYVAKGNHLGCYRLRFNSPHFLLRINGWYTRFNGKLSGGGDQSLFILKNVFESLDGFDEYRAIMEDFHFVRKAKRNYRFCVMKGEILVSARKYENNGYFRVNISNAAVVILNRLGVPPGILAKLYKKMLRPVDASTVRKAKRKRRVNEITRAA